MSIKTKEDEINLKLQSAKALLYAELVKAGITNPDETSINTLIMEISKLTLK
ncbi:MAG: hypothetical protein ACRC92_11250 [Peptostreptococcaceae bacterium]